MSVVLLDTMVAAGVFLFGDTSGKREAWRDAVLKLIDGDYRVAVPTTVFYELKARDSSWYQWCHDKANASAVSPVFQYINYSVTSEILSLSAAYRLLCGERDRNNKSADKEIQQRVGFGDAILAAYALKFGYWIMTINQKDFPNQFFQAQAIGLAPVPNGKSERRVIYLLSPKVDEWKAELQKLLVRSET